MRPSSAFLSDSNSELINAYQQVKLAPKTVHERLSNLPVDEDSYYEIRKYVPDSNIDRAVRFLYLNRTCFNGIWRTNREGLFNVPYGKGTRIPDTILNNDILKNASAALRDAELAHCDFREMLSKTGEGDFVYCDPAYTVAHSNNGFLRYNERVFSWADQTDLRNYAVEARSRGATIIISNAADNSIFNLYYPFKPIMVRRNSSVGGKKGRGRFNEFVFVLSPINSHRKLMLEILREHNLFE